MGKKAVSIALVAMMVFSGFGFLSVGIDQEVEPVAEIVEIEPRDTPTTGLVKTVMVEEFTNARCTFCPMAERNLLPVLENFTYAKAAPLQPHVWWPAGNDSVWQYSSVDVVPRKNYYNFNGVPYSVFDGQHVRHAIGDPEIDPYVEYMEKALGVLARFSIQTYGDLGTETVGCVIEAHEVIEANPNRYVRFGFWEDKIDVKARFGEKGQYFDTYHWAMWDMLPDALGEQVFPAGANPGDKVWFNRSFFIDPAAGVGGMVPANLGVSVWIQDDNDHNVEQAAVEDFQADPPLPTHELAAYGLEIDDNPMYTLLGPLNEVAAGATVQVNGTVCNWGQSDETNIQVDLIVDGVPQDTQMIASLEAGHGEMLTFDWSVPTVAGDYWVGVQCSVAAGESNITNNVVQRLVTVRLTAIVQPSTLSDMEFYAPPDGIDFDNLTLDNVGLADLDYDVSIGTTADVVGSWGYGTSRIFNYDNGGCFLASSSTTLIEHKMMLEITAAVNLCWVVYEGNTQTGVYNHISNVSTPNPPLGRGWYSSGPLNIPITAGLYYIIGITWTGSGGLTYGFGEEPVPTPVSFGEYRGRWYNLIDIPPPLTVDPIIISGSLTIKQALVTDDGTGDWLSATPDPGSIPPMTQQDIMLTADAAGLTEGVYPTTMNLWTNDPKASIMTCTVTFNVIGDMPPTVSLITPNGGEVWMGGVSNAIIWNMSDDGPMTDLVVNIYYSTDGGLTWPGTVTTGLTGYTVNPCVYNWDPTPIIDSDQVRIWINVWDTLPQEVDDFSDADFEIDSTAPAPATNVRAELTATHVTIYWDPSADHGGGDDDVVRYEIYYILNNWDPTGDSYNFLVDKGLATSHQHNNAGVNNPSSYCWQIRTFDVAGHETRSIIQAGKTGSMQSTFVNPSGWFMVGSHLIQSNTTVEHMIQGAGLPANADHITLYRDGAWLHWAPHWPPSMNTLTDIYPGEGFWLHVTANTRFATAGYISDMAIPVKAGWNMVAYPFAESTKSTAEIIAHLETNPLYEEMEILDPGAPYRLTIPGGTEILAHGSGFWVRFSGDTTWTVTNY